MRMEGILLHPTPEGYVGECLRAEMGRTSTRECRAIKLATRGQARTDSQTEQEQSGGKVMD
jgi:hypothetical protein